MLISPKTTLLILFFSAKEAQLLLGNYKHISQKYCDVKMTELKNEMLGTMVPQLMQLSVMMALPVTKVIKGRSNHLRQPLTVFVGGGRKLSP